MRVLIACEESQAVCKEFRALGHEAFSCDIQECSGGHPEWHYKQDVFEVINMGWDMMICFPPCTHLAVSGGRHFAEKIKDGRQQQGIGFFMKLANANIERIAIENPIGIMSSKWRKPDQIIQPYYFGDDAGKSTCLWLKNLPLLKHFPQDDMFNKKTWVEQTFITTSKGTTYDKWWYDTCMITLKNGLRGKARSKTFPGIANAMAQQWGNL